jgi:hypothetical protein
MTEWIRVKDKSTKHEYTVAVVDPDAHDILKKDATSPDGTPLPAKPHTTAGSRAANTEES